MRRTGAAAFVTSLMGVISVLAAVSDRAHALGYRATPTITWIAAALPSSSKTSLDRIAVVDSSGRRAWATTGSCSVRGTTLVAGKTGTCRVTLRVSETPKFAATTSSAVLQVKNSTELNVLAAASLTAAMTDVGKAFMAKYLNVTVRFNFAGSSTLVTQIQQGAPSDVVALADTANMDKLVASNQVSQTAVTTLVRNKLAILVQRGNPLRIGSLSDLVRQGVKTVFCDTAQPCGKYATSVLSNANVSLTPAGREASASGVVSRIANGEADAGIAYVTDGLVSGDKVDPVNIPDSINVVANYPIAVLKSPSTRDTAAISAFITMATGSVGDSTFAKYGFIVP